jgi:hypothetical protein
MAVAHRRHARSLRPPDPAQVRRVDTRLQAALVLLLVANAVAAPGRLSRPGRTAAIASPSLRPCPAAPPLTVPEALHEAAEFARAPITSAFDAGRDAYYEHIAHRCTPQENAIEHALLQVADSAVGVLESVLLGPTGALAIREGANALDLAGDAMEGKPLDTALLVDTLLAQGGIKPAGGRAFAPPDPMALPAARADSSARIFDRAAQLIGEGPTVHPDWIIAAPADARGLLRYRDPLSGKTGRALQLDGRYHAVQLAGVHRLVTAGTVLEHRDGIYWLREREHPQGADAIAVEGEESTRRCRRDPGGPCAPSTIAYSNELDAVLRAHHDQGLTQLQANQRGIMPDPQRPGWHVRLHHGQRKAFLHFQGRYFRARSYRLGDCERVALYAARVSHLGEVALSHPLGGQRLVDIAESPTPSGPRFMTQAEYNVRFRGFNSLNAAQVYEQAVRNAPVVHLSQSEQAAIVNYARAERPLLDAFLQHGPAPASQIDVLAQQAQDLRRGLAQIPAHVGPVYRGATLPARALEGLEVGHTVFCRSFLRASGDRAVAMRELAARGNEIDHAPLLVTLHMVRAAHPVGLYTLQDEAGVLIDSGRVFKVVARREGELELEEAGVTRQAFGQRGARPLDLS